MDFDPKKRAEEKRLSREKDAQDLADGTVTQEELAQRNGAFAFGGRAKINWNAVRESSYNMNKIIVIKNPDDLGCLSQFYKPGFNGSVRLRDQIFHFRNGKLDRDDGPSIEYDNGGKKWFKDDLLHRDNGPAIEFSDGSKFYFIEGKRHRLSGPAIEWSDGDREWYVDNKLHKLNEPAIIYANGKVEYWEHGERIKK
jgi:hypothetical protein